MLIQCEGQEDIINLDHVSVIRQYEDADSNLFSIKFLKVTGNGSWPIAEWIFKADWEKDKVLEEILSKGLSITLAGDEGIDLSGF